MILLGGIAAGPWMRAALRYGAIVLTVLLFLLSLRRSGERTGLPRDPVDFEQREGRIARYASLAVRQSLGNLYGLEALARTTYGSPFSKLLAVAGEQPSGRTGLERWWLPERGKPVSVSFD